MFPFVDEINLAGSLHLAFFGLLIPFAVVRGRMKLRQAKGPLPKPSASF
jgi:hypothetical protein